MATYVKRGAPAATIADATALTDSFTANTLTADGTITIADGDAATTGENLEYCFELHTVQDTLVTKVNSILSALEGVGIVLDA